MIFVFPLVLSLAAAVMFVIGDYGLFTKVFVVILVATAAAMEFVPALSHNVHFLIPLFMQLFVGGWWYFASKLEGL